MYNFNGLQKGFIAFLLYAITILFFSVFCFYLSGSGVVAFVLFWFLVVNVLSVGSLFFMWYEAKYRHKLK